MLLRFEVANYRSMMDSVELSMIAVDNDRLPVRQFESISEGVLTVTAIYGPNASGKTNILEALAWLSAAVRQSLRAWDAVIPREPFRFGNGPATSTSYETEMVVDGVRYAYSVELDDSSVIFEGLYSYPARRRRTLFEREGLEISFRRGLASSLAGARELLTPTTLALSAAMRFDDAQIRAFGQHLATIRPIGLGRPLLGGFRFSYPLGQAFMVTERIFAESASPAPDPVFGQLDGLGVTGPADPDPRGQALALLRFADLGIDDVRVITDEDDAQALPAARRGPRQRLQLVHHTAGQELPFELSDESAGTQTWLALIGPALAALGRGQVVLVDEIDASLHPQLSARLLELFQDPETNPLDAQLIFTSHDTSLLNHLNRDEVWLTAKNDSGATTLTALAEYGGDKVRRSLNIERAYLQGRFGSVPDLDQHRLRKVLGTSPGGA